MSPCRQEKSNNGEYMISNIVIEIEDRASGNSKIVNEKAMIHKVLAVACPNH